MKDFYDEYWSVPAPAAASDPLAETRNLLLWSSLAALQAPSGRLLECGTGAGRLIADATAKGFEAVGMDISSVGIERARQRFPGCSFLEHNLEDRPWPVSGGDFDVVVAFEVIEHLLRPRELLLGARDVLRRDGHLALTTPYHGLMKNAALTVAGFERHFAVEGEHIRFFTDSSLRALLDQCGFEVERVQHFGRFWGLWAGVYMWARSR